MPCELADGTVTLVASSPGECELEMWSAEPKSTWLGDIFNAGVRFERRLAVPAQKEAAAGHGASEFKL